MERTIGGIPGEPAGRSGAGLASAPTWRVDRRSLAATVGLLTAYGLAFAALHNAAAPWQIALGPRLWEPEAGLRFALLWRSGSRLTLPIAIVELIIGMIGAPPGASRSLLLNLNLAAVPLCYGAVIWLLQRRLRGADATRRLPTAAGLACVIAPLVSSTTAPLLRTMLLFNPPGVITMAGEVKAATVFTLGHMLGIITIAPPLLWFADPRHRRLPAPPDAAGTARIAEATAVFGAGWLLALLLWWAGMGVRLEPLVLCVTWIGLRLGRVAAWLAVSVTVAIVLAHASAALASVDPIALHLLLVSIGVAGLLAGIYADAGRAMRIDLARRDRLLFQAERLRTLRAMSLAVIHEVTQPLSTLSLETRHLVKLAADEHVGADVREAAALIARKTDDLAELVRRLRSFGGRATAEAASVPIAPLLRDVAGIVAAEAAEAKVTLAIDSRLNAAVNAQEVELRQAVLNIVRNAIAASPGAVVRLAALRTSPQHLEIQIEDAGQSSRPRAGMGIGLIVARTIIETYGGRLLTERAAGGGLRQRIELPIAEGQGD